MLRNKVIRIEAEPDNDDLQLKVVQALMLSA